MKLLIVDDEVLIRQGLNILMSQYPDIDIAGECANGEEAVFFCRHHAVDLILMDIRMMPMNGVEATRQILAEASESGKTIRILILTTFQDEIYISDAIQAGASGYLLKDSSGSKIYEALKTIYQGSIVLEAKVAGNLLSKTAEDMQAIDSSKILKQFDLTEKDLDLISVIAEGLNNKEISDRLFLAEGTVKNNISNLLAKLELRDRTQLAIFAYKNQLIK